MGIIPLYAEQLAQRAEAGSPLNERMGFPPFQGTPSPASLGLHIATHRKAWFTPPEGVTPSTRVLAAMRLLNSPGMQVGDIQRMEMGSPVKSLAVTFGRILVMTAAGSRVVALDNNEEWAMSDLFGPTQNGDALTLIKDITSVRTDGGGYISALPGSEVPDLGISFFRPGNSAINGLLLTGEEGHPLLHSVLAQGSDGGGGLPSVNWTPRDDLLTVKPNYIYDYPDANHGAVSLDPRAPCWGWAPESLSSSQGIPIPWYLTSGTASSYRLATVDGEGGVVRWPARTDLAPLNAMPTYGYDVWNSWGGELAVGRVTTNQHGAVSSQFVSRVDFDASTGTTGRQQFLGRAADAFDVAALRLTPGVGMNPGNYSLSEMVLEHGDRLRQAAASLGGGTAHPNTMKFHFGTYGRWAYFRYHDHLVRVWLGDDFLS